VKQETLPRFFVHSDRAGQGQLVRWMSLAISPDRSYLSLLPWLIVVACGLACKAQWLRYGGYSMAASAMSRPFESQQSFSRLEQLAFFNGDLLLTCLAIPLVLLIIARFLPVAWRAVWIVIVSLLGSSIILTQYSAFSTTGRFATWSILRTGLDWWYENPNAGDDVVARNFQLRLTGAVLLVLLLGILGFLLMKRSRPWFVTTTARMFQCSAMACLMIALVTYPAASNIPVFARDMLLESTRALFGNSNSGLDSRIFAKSPEQQYAVYRQLANVPANAPSVSGYFGRAADCNVLIFIFETTPARVLNPATDDLHDFPNLRRLRERSLVATQHFTTAPATDLASFAIFSSIYSSNHIGGSVNQRLPGLMQVLDSAGYQTGFYGYIWKGNGDDAMLRNLGFHKLVNSDLGTTFFARLEEKNLTLNQRVLRDIGPLNRLKADIAEWARTKQKFAAVFFPQMGHGPWPPVPGEPDSSADERARFLARYQDAWIGELCQQLQASGELDHTIVIVTADHGIRFRSENDALPVGKIDDMSFHVPLLVFVPKLLDHEQFIAWPTSHIDLQPTILDLLGIRQGRQWEQGMAIWNPMLANRRVFLLGDKLFGADGYYDGHQAMMLQNQLGTVFANSSLHFDRHEPVTKNSSVAKDARNMLREFDSFEAAVDMELRNGIIH
jgi:glucan phosphoethanolaminetransferase (alkaline phosphatase superfamily)